MSNDDFQIDLINELRELNKTLQVIASNQKNSKTVLNVSNVIPKAFRHGQTILLQRPPKVSVKVQDPKKNRHTTTLNSDKAMKLRQLTSMMRNEKNLNAQLKLDDLIIYYLDQE